MGEQEWNDTAEAGYASNVARTSTVAALRLIDMMDSVSPIDADSYVLDVGTGTGAVPLNLARLHPDTKILATDISAQMMENMRGLTGLNIKTQVVDAHNLQGSLREIRFSHAFSTFMLQTTTSPDRVLQEMLSSLDPGGIIGLAVWTHRIDPFLIWDQACQTLDPPFANPHEFDDPYAWRTTQDLEHYMNLHELQEIYTMEIQMPFSFETAELFADFWFKGKNPVAVKVIDKFQHERGVDMSEIKQAVIKICREKYENGKNVICGAALGVGRKI